MFKRKLVSTCVFAAIYGISGSAMSADEEVIVTGVAEATSVFESTSSVTAVDGEDVRNFAPASAADIFKNLPGIQSEATGGESNANIKIRGLPISAGGARYLSIQEDGLPALLIGDFDFATSDSFVRFDDHTASVQSIRGGSASTQAANAAGGIVNFISKTGAEKGGSVAIRSGVDFDSNRIDFSYGEPINDNWSFHVAGYGRKGEGPRDQPEDLEDGLQLRLTAANEFEKGFFKVHVKHLDERTPTFLPLPTQFGGGTTLNEVGVDTASGTLTVQGTAPTGDGRANPVTTGFESEFDSVAFQGEYDVSDSTTLGGNVRFAEIGGRFVSVFPLGANDDGSGTNIAGNNLQGLIFNTNLDSLNNTFLDLFAKHDFGAVTAKFGLFYGEQDYDATWNFSAFDTPLSTFAQTQGAEQEIPVPGVTGEDGVCCDFDLTTTVIAPSVTLLGDINDSVSWDASIRQDNYEVDGIFVTGGGGSGDADYDFDFLSFSGGVNWVINDNNAVFANYSQGGSAIAPTRVANAGNINNVTGQLGDEEQGFTEVEQLELGYRYENDRLFANATLFFTETQERGGFEITTGNLIENDFESQGIEVEAGYDIGSGWNIRGSITLTDAEITDSNTPATIGNTPRRQADWIFNVSPTYSNDVVSAGLAFIGTDNAFAGDNNALEFDSFIVTNAFVNVAISKSLTLGLAAGNLFDEEGFTEAEETAPLVGDLVRARPINGRTVSASLRYNFN